MSKILTNFLILGLLAFIFTRLLRFKPFEIVLLYRRGSRLTSA